MATLRNMRTLCFCPSRFLFFLLLFSSPNLSGRRLDSTILLHMVWH